MTKLSKKNRKVGYVVLIGVLLACGLVIASNMGFKLVHTLYAPSGDTGTNWVAVPFNFPFNNAEVFFNDIDAVSGSASEVTRYLRTSDSYQSYTGAKGDPVFPIDRPRYVT